MPPTLPQLLSAPEWPTPTGILLVGHEPGHPAPDTSGLTRVEFAELGIAAASIQAALAGGIVRFSYWAVIKKRLRMAVGTTNPAYFSYDFRGGGTPPPAGLVRYWDFSVAPDERGGQWRSFYVANARTVAKDVAPGALTPQEIADAVREARGD